MNTHTQTAHLPHQVWGWDGRRSWNQAQFSPLWLLLPIPRATVGDSTGPTGRPGFFLSSRPQFVEHLIKEQRCSLRLAPPVTK